MFSVDIQGAWGRNQWLCHRRAPPELKASHGHCPSPTLADGVVWVCSIAGEPGGGGAAP